MDLFVAPLQGYTDSAWRRFHAEVYGPVASAYYSPFIRMERGEVRRHDLGEIAPECNDGYRLVPQIIFRDADEFGRLVDAVAASGYGEVDLNLGCPFPLQTRKGRGAAMLRRPEILSEIASVMNRRDGMRFSVKMRLGLEEPDEWQGVIDILNRMPLVQIAVHPRTARQGYAGELHGGEFGRILGRSEHPVVFNGGLLAPADFTDIAGRYPQVAGLMVGRGLLGRPSLLDEVAGGEEWSRERRMSHLKIFHDLVFNYSVDRYQGDSQILSKLKPFWDYLEPEIGRKAAKVIRKAGTLGKYRSAVAAAGADFDF